MVEHRPKGGSVRKEGGVDRLLGMRRVGSSPT